MKAETSSDASDLADGGLWTALDYGALAYARWSLISRGRALIFRHAGSGLRTGRLPMPMAVSGADGAGSHRRCLLQGRRRSPLFTTSETLHVLPTEDVETSQSSHGGRRGNGFNVGVE